MKKNLFRNKNNYFLPSIGKKLNKNLSSANIKAHYKLGKYKNLKSEIKINYKNKNSSFIFNKEEINKNVSNFMINNYQN